MDYSGQRVLFNDVLETSERKLFHSGCHVPDLYSSVPRSADNVLSMNVSGPPGHRSSVSIESTYDLLGTDWRREEETIVTQTAKGSSAFDIEVPVTPGDQAFYRARFRDKE